jgi:hypothetical protein
MCPVLWLTELNLVYYDKTYHSVLRVTGHCKYYLIQKCILAGNRLYFAAISVFRSRLLSRATKILLYKTLVRLVSVILSGTMGNDKE